ncbi:MAG: hypothetical protein P1Q69_17520 [Candidatus Thorarchaeota archaeon]|nr:hypothetical protein [Candidatus Thorarchaeota archaeon]
MSLERRSAVYSTYFYTKTKEFLETLFAAYSTCIGNSSCFYWIEKTPTRTSSLKHVFLCLGLELKPLVDEIAERIRGLGLTVVNRSLDLETSFLHVTDSLISNTLTFWRKDDRLGIIVITKTKSRLRGALPLLVATLVGLIVLFVLLPSLIEIMGYDITSPDIIPPVIILSSVVLFVTLALSEWAIYRKIVKSGESITPLVRAIVETRGSCKFRFGGRSPFKFPPRVVHRDINLLFKVLKQEERHPTV